MTITTIITRIRTFLTALMLRLRIAVARVLLRGTDYMPVRQYELALAQDTIHSLDEYVQKSGGLRTPHRIRAYYKVTRALAKTDLALQRALERTLKVTS